MTEQWLIDPLNTLKEQKLIILVDPRRMIMTGARAAEGPDKARPGSDVDLLDWLRQCRRAGLYEQGRAIYENGGLNLANLTDEQQIEAEDDYRICVRRGSEQEAKPKKRQRKIIPDENE